MREEKKSSMTNAELGKKFHDEMRDLESPQWSPELLAEWDRRDKLKGRGVRTPFELNRVYCPKIQRYDRVSQRQGKQNDR